MLFWTFWFKPVVNQSISLVAILILVRYCRKLQYLSVLEFSWKNIMPCFTQYSPTCDCYRYDFMKIFVFLNFTTIYTYVLIKNIIFKLRNFFKKNNKLNFWTKYQISPAMQKKSFPGDNKHFPVWNCFVYDDSQYISV